ncbi:cytochrome b562 [Citrobacter freundii]
MMSLWDALRMNMMISYQELVRTFQSYRAALKEEDVTSFRKDMRELKATAESILNSPVEGYDRETYVAGMSLLIDEVTAVESTAEKEGLDAGKIAAQKLGSLMRKYHNKLGVD